MKVTWIKLNRGKNKLNSCMKYWSFAQLMNLAIHLKVEEFLEKKHKFSIFLCMKWELYKIQKHNSLEIKTIHRRKINVKFYVAYDGHFGSREAITTLTITIWPTYLDLIDRYILFRLPPEKLQYENLSKNPTLLLLIKTWLM